MSLSRQEREEVRDHFVAICSEFNSVGDPVEILTGAYGAISTMPEPLSALACESIEIEIDRQGDQRLHTVKIDFKGSESKLLYGHLAITFENDEGLLNLDAITSGTLMIAACVNRPEDSPDWILAALADRGISPLRCSECGLSCASLKEAQAHELAAHGLPPAAA